MLISDRSGNDGGISGISASGSGNSLAIVRSQKSRRKGRCGALVLGRVSLILTFK
jgi:hypothetical protein